MSVLIVTLLVCGATGSCLALGFMLGRQRGFDEGVASVLRAQINDMTRTAAQSAQEIAQQKAMLAAGWRHRGAQAQMAPRRPG